MADVKYEKDTQRFDCLGLDVNRPVDSVKPGHFPYLKNCRAYVAGRLEPRFGMMDLSEVVAGQSPVHSIRRLNDPTNSTWTRVIGTGTHLAIGQSAPYTDLDSGYSGDPLALQPWKPDTSPTPYMYVADRSRMRKVTAGGTLDTIGYAAPSTAPAVALSAPSYKVVDEFDSTAGWANAGTAGAPSLLSAGPGYRTTSTIAQILYDTGTTGWACVNLTSMAGTGQGERLTFNPGGGTAETVTVQEIHPVSATTTISRIIYDSGTSGDCSIILATPVEQMEVNTLIRDTTVGENARVVAVIAGPDGTTSIRVSTVGTWAATDSIAALASMRVYLASNHAAAETVRTDGMRSAITSGTGTLTLTSALDLSVIATGVAAYPDDYMHISLRVDRPDLVTELKIQLDVDIATNDFTRNYYWRSFRSSDLTPAARNLQPLLSTRTQVLQREVIDTPIVPRGTGTEAVANIDDVTTDSASDAATSQEMGVGDVQWCELIFHLADLIRVGTDDNRSLANVAAIRIVALVTGNVTLDMDSWWIGGGFGPDTGSTTAVPYLYRYRVRNPATNVPSNFSPATRLSVNSWRQQIVVSPTQYAAPSGTNITATNLVLDVERFGGEVTDWHYVGTISNSATPSFTDKYDDAIVLGNPIIDNAAYQPWPVKGVPVSGTTGNVAGTTVNDAATNFNTSWAPGTRIIIGSVPFTIYRVISTSRLELVENAGSQNGVSWRIDEPTILAQPLPCLWEWDGTFFACGDSINAGRLYYSSPDSETTEINNYIDLTPPSEQLQNGLQFNIRSYVFSSESFIQILKTGNPVAPYRHEHIPNGKGLFSRWALTREPAPVICFLARDGINMTTGGSPVPLTDAELYELFPNEGNIGANVNGVYAPNIVAAQANYLRLSYYDEYLYFDYAAISGGYATLALAFDLGAVNRGGAPGGWFWDLYTPNVIMHYGEEGSGVHSMLLGTTNSHLYQYAGHSDNGVAFSMEFSTPSLDQGDPRSNKLYGDIMLDADLAGLTATVTPYFNNNVASVAAVAATNAARGLTTIPLGSAWQTYRNISMNVVVSISTSASPKFYIWEPRWTFEAAPIAALSWEISPTTFGMDNFKHMGLVKIAHVSTVDLDLIFTVDGVAQPTITVTNSGGIYTEDIFRVPVMKGKLYKLRLASSDGATDFRLDARDTFFEVRKWGDDNAYAHIRPFADYALIEG